MYLFLVFLYFFVIPILLLKSLVIFFFSLDLFPDLNICDSNLDTADLPYHHFISPNVAGKYPPNQNCSQRVELQANFSAFIVNIHHLELEISDNCVRDYLELIADPGRPNEQVLRLCEAPKKDLTFNAQQLLVRFVSDAIIEKRGFRLTLSKVLEDTCPHSNLLIGSHVITSR